MNFNDFIQTISDSSAEDWNVIYCGGLGTGPSYHEDTSDYVQAATMEARTGEMRVWPQRAHTSVAAYKPDISITVAWGLGLDEAEVQEDWAQKFANKRAFLYCADLFYNNALVERVPYVSVDGARCILPVPAIPSLVVKRQDVDILRAIASLYISDANYDNYLARAGFKIV